MKPYRSSSSSRYRDRTAQERRRLEAAKLFKKGILQADIARRLKVTPAAVSQWHKTWQKGGAKNLRSLGHPGRKPKLTDAKLAAIRKTLLRGPRRAGYATDIWTLKRIKAVIRKKTRISYGITHIWRILTIQLRWSAQKPETRARERDEEKIRHWKHWVWPQIKRGQKTCMPA
jgi:putative transposase